MKNGLIMFAVFATAGAAAAACPAPVRDQVAEATQIPERMHIEVDRQLDMFVSWVRDDSARPQEDLQNRNLD
tara:strand:+ start:12106 stop:12321 length:216 start_codon:yes stop_codon:yes gene_type:complete